MADGEQLIIELEARLTKFERAFERASQVADKRWREVESHGKRSSVAIEATFSKSATTIERAASAANAAILRMGTALGTALSVREIAQAADAWQSYQNKLAGLGVPTDKVADTLNRLVEVALRTRTDLGATVDLFAKLTLVSEQYGLRADQAQRITETVSKSLKVAGASASEAASTITQLSQALASGTLQGDELRSLRENAPLLLKAIAKELGTTTGALKTMGSEGKLTSDLLIKALLKASTEIDAAFKKTNPTLADGFVNLQTTFTQLVGEFDRGSGLSRQLATALNDAGLSLQELKGKASGWGEAMAGDIEKAVKAAKKLYEILSVLGKWSPTGLLARYLSGDFGGGKKPEKFGPDIPGDLFYKGDDSANPLDTSNIKGVPKDYTKQTTDLLQSIQARTEALKVEIATYGKSTYEVERARVAQDLLSHAKNAEIPITDALRQKIDAASDAYAEQAVRLERLKTAFAGLQEIKSQTQEFFGSIAKDIANGTNATEALYSALGRLQDRAIDLASSKIFDLIFGVTSGGTVTGGGLSGVLMSMLGGHAEGGLIRGPGSGTSDSMLTRVSDGEFITNAAQTSKYLDLLQAINNGQNLKIPTVGNSIAVSSPVQTFAPVIQISGGSDSKQTNSELADIIERRMRDLFEQMYARRTVKEMRFGGLFNAG
ncbi:MAG: tape measure protein [Xanthobacteraceae bacterium]